MFRLESNEYTTERSIVEKSYRLFDDLLGVITKIRYSKEKEKYKTLLIDYYLRDILSFVFQERSGSLQKIYEDYRTNFYKGGDNNEALRTFGYIMNSETKEEVIFKCRNLYGI
jgi:hypothetical protein